MALAWARWFLALRRQEANLGMAILWSTSWKIINNQLQVMRRFKHLVSKDVRARLYKAFILPFFQYCSAVCHCCGVRSSDKLELLNIQAMRLVFNDFTSNYKSKRREDPGYAHTPLQVLTSLFHVRISKHYPRGIKSSLCLRWQLLLLDLTLFNT